MRFVNNYLYLGERIIKFSYFIVINRNDDFNHSMHRKYLDGEAEGNLKLWTFDRLEYYRALRYIRKNEIRYWKPKSTVSQFRIATKDKVKLYPEKHTDLNVITFDIETTGLNSEKDNIIMIIAHHSKFGLQIFKHHNERKILADFEEYLLTHDYDVLNGHNIVNFDIPFVSRRFEILFKRKMLWKENATMYQSQYYSILPYRYGKYFYKKVFINNVDIVDTMMMVMSFDLIKRECQNYKLKYLEQFFNLINSEERVYLTGEEIKVAKKSMLLKYCQQDVESTLKLYEMFIPSYYYQLLYFPMSLQDVVFNTIVPKWDSAIVIDYLNRDMSIPLPISDEDIVGEKFEGAITGCLKKGVIKNVRKIDVASLYPSIIIKHHIKSNKDYLDVAYNKFVKITKDRLWYKARKKENKLYDYIQSALKYIINPYFGYLGNEYSLYSNLDGAAKVTEYGRYYIIEILKYMEEFGAEIIEIDTDGVIYSGEKLADKINQKLPKEIQVEDEGFWSQMISYSKKNYILYNAERDWVKKGVFFKSSSMNLLKRQFVDDFIDCIFEKKDFNNLLLRYYEKITSGKCNVDELKQRFRASQTLEEYLQSLKENQNKNPQLPYEYFIKNNIDFSLEDVVYLYKARQGKKYETMESVENFDGLYDTRYYLKMIFGFIIKVYKNAPEILPKQFLEVYDDYRYMFTGVKTRKKKEKEK